MVVSGRGEVVIVTISSQTHTILFLQILLEQHATNVCSFYFYFLPCIMHMLHASEACLAFMMLRIMLSLHCQTHVEHALTMCYTHVLLYINHS